MEQNFDTRVSATVSPDWSAMIGAFLAHKPDTPVHLARVLAADPGFALGHLFRGLAMLMAGRAELVPAARDSLATARLAGSDARSRAYEAALEAWLAGSLTRAADRLDLWLATDPTDILAAKLVHQIRFMAGDAPGMRRSIEAVLAVLDPTDPAHGYLSACHAFALEETHDYARAERLGRAAIERTSDDAWGVHGVAHVLEMTDRAGEGLAWVEAQRARWQGSNNFRYHVFWHAALFHLSEGRPYRALELYDTEIRRDRTDDYRDIANASALLVRLEIAGVHVGRRWEELADLCEKRREEGTVVFATLHYGLSLMGADRADSLYRLTGATDRMARTRTTEMAEVAADTGAAMAAALHEFRFERYDTAFDLYLSAAPRLERIGGSRAQRDVFHQIGIEAALRAGRLNAAREMLARRRKDRGYDDSFDRRTRTRLDTLTAFGTPRTPQWVPNPVLAAAS